MANKFEEELDALAEKIAAEAKQEGTKLPDRLDAMKVLTPYYALRLKHKPEDPDSSGTFADFAESIESNNAPVRSN